MQDNENKITDSSSKETKENQSDKLKEPLVAYSGSKKISFSNTFEEAEESQIRYWAGLSPEQRFSDFLELMIRFYSFGKPNWVGKKIIIDG